MVSTERPFATFSREARRADTRLARARRFAEWLAWLCLLAVPVLALVNVPTGLLASHPTEAAVAQAVFAFEVIRTVLLSAALIGVVVYRKTYRATVAAIWLRRRRIYLCAAVLVLNVAVVFAMLNLAALVYRAVADALWTPPVLDKYGEQLIAEMYPDLERSEVVQLLKETWQRPERYGPPLSWIKDTPSTGRYVNATEHGFRQNARPMSWPPPVDARNVFFFGGSTTWGYGLPDWQTIPSQLDELVRAENTNVYNFGRCSFKLANERVFFELLLLLGYHPDVAVFLDGLNETWPYPDDPTTSLRAEFEQRGNHPRFAWEAIPVFGELASAIASRRYLDRPPNPAWYAAPGWAADRVGQYLANKAALDRTCAAHGIRCLFFWQPIAEYKAEKATFPFGDGGEFSAAKRRVYQYAAGAFAVTPGEPVHWLADIQDGETGLFYVDGCHYNARMAEMLAQSIAATLPRPVSPRPAAANGQAPNSLEK